MVHDLLAFESLLQRMSSFESSLNWNDDEETTVQEYLENVFSKSMDGITEEQIDKFLDMFDENDDWLSVEEKIIQNAADIREAHRKGQIKDGWSRG